MSHLSLLIAQRYTVELETHARARVWLSKGTFQSSDICLNVFIFSREPLCVTCPRSYEALHELLGMHLSVKHRGSAFYVRIDTSIIVDTYNESNRIRDLDTLHESNRIFHNVRRDVQ